MSHPPTHPSKYQTSMILDEIDKAFKQVNLICKHYFQTQNKPKINSQNPHHFNFNNYKAITDPKNQSTQTEKILNLDDQDSYQSPLQQHQTQKPTITNKKQDIKSKGKKSINLLNKQLSSQQSQKPQTPQPPKAPLSPYFTFYKQKKDVIKSEFPDMSVTQIASAAAKVWKSLSDEEKEPYTKKYYEQKQKHEAQMGEYVRKYPNYKENLKKVLGPNNKK